MLKICALQRDPNDAIAALVDDSIWSILSQAVSDRQTEARQDALTFICSRGCSFDDYCSMFDDVFVLYEVVKGQGELHPLRRVPHSLFLISEGILRLARISVERVTEVTWLHHCSSFYLGSTKLIGPLAYKFMALAFWPSEGSWRHCI